MSETALTDAFIYDGIRTPFGRHAGALAPVRPDDLLAHVIRTVVEKNDFPKEAFEDVIAGNTNQAGEDCRNVGRFASLLAGMPVEVGGLTVNRLCGGDPARCEFGENTRRRTVRGRRRGIYEPRSPGVVQGARAL